MRPRHSRRDASCGNGFCAADSRALLVAEIFDLPLDQVKRIDAPHRFMCRARLFALRVGQGFKRLENRLLA